MARQGTKSATIGYQPPGYPAYPGHLCTSVNHVVCHGIPNDKPLKKGDIVNVDVTVITEDGWFGDTSRMFLVGECSIAAKRLCALTYEAMWLGIAQVKPGARLGDIGHAIQSFAEGHGLSVVRELCGHGIGKKFHEDPQVLHYGRPGTGEVLRPGMVFTIEPMLNLGKRDIKELGKDGWTIITKDRSLSAQWEHTVAVTETGHEVLSLSPAFCHASVCVPCSKLLGLNALYQELLASSGLSRFFSAILLIESPLFAPTRAQRFRKTKLP